MPASDGMRFSIGLVPGVPQDTIRTARAAEENGFDLLRVGDIPSTHREAYCSLTLCAMHTSSIRLGPGVSTPQTRHPALTASSIATLDEISGGRAFLGLGTGDSAVRNLGLQPATLAELRQYMDVVRDLLSHGRARHGEADLVMRNWSTRVPIIMAAHGPKSLRLAGEKADGVIAGLGLSEDAIDYAYTHIAQGAHDAGRSMDDIEVWFLNYINLSEDDDRGRARIAASIAAGGNLLARSPAAATVPARHRSALADLAARYRYTKHVDNSAGSDNGRLVEELGLLDYLAERFALAGDAASVIAGIEAARQRAVRNLWSIYNRADIDSFLGRWGQEVMPSRRSSQD